MSQFGFSSGLLSGGVLPGQSLANGQLATPSSGIAAFDNVLSQAQGLVDGKDAHTHYVGLSDTTSSEAKIFSSVFQGFQLESQLALERIQTQSQSAKAAISQTAGLKLSDNAQFVQTLQAIQVINHSANLTAIRQAEKQVVAFLQGSFETLVRTYDPDTLARLFVYWRSVRETSPVFDQIQSQLMTLIESMPHDQHEQISSFLTQQMEEAKQVTSDPAKQNALILLLKQLQTKIPVNKGDN